MGSVRKYYQATFVSFNRFDSFVKTTSFQFFMKRNIGIMGNENKIDIKIIQLF